MYMCMFGTIYLYIICIFYFIIHLSLLMSESNELGSTPPPPLPPSPQLRAMLPPEEDLQTYKRSLVSFRNINGSRIN